MLLEMTGAHTSLKTEPSTGGLTSDGTVGTDGGNAITGAVNGMLTLMSDLECLSPTSEVSLFGS